MLDIVFNNFTTDRKYGGKFFEKVMGVAAKELGLESKSVELSVNLVGEGRIKALNKKYRGRNRVTDVLSFPLDADLRGLNADRRRQIKTRTYADKDKNVIMSLGDIFICLPVAKKYAMRENVSLDFKLSFLAVHGFLHLLGHDHEKSAEEKDKMFSLQDNILAKLSF